MALNLFSATTQMAFTCLTPSQGGVQGYAKLKQATCNSTPLFPVQDSPVESKQESGFVTLLSVGSTLKKKHRLLHTLVLASCLTLSLVDVIL